jgi:hypothetical protein
MSERSGGGERRSAMGKADRIAVVYHDRARTQFTAWNGMGQLVARGEYRDLAEFLAAQRGDVPVVENDWMAAVDLELEREDKR